ncbi:hypothetical protein NQZ79_g1800 [Umbelopsis isabellina]|nr:hypothetical protein NQZ79_g1800 [Umbelopsis isabellina]
MLNQGMDCNNSIRRFPPELEYHDFITAAKELSKELRDPNGPYHVDLVVALTHMRVPNDIKLSKTCQGVVDLVLGGHDHFYYLSKAVNIVGENWSRQQNLEELGFDPEQGNDPCDTLYVIKSGTDFRELSLLTIDIEKDQSGKCVVTAVSADRKPITSDMKVDEKTEGLVQDIAKTVSTKTAYAIGYTMTALDGRSSAVRTKETTLGNITSDLMMNAYNSRIGQVDAAFCCGGTFRSDKIHGPGPVTIGDILDIFPYEDPVVVIKVTGQQLWDALENSVSEYPKQEGRFPQLAGLRIEWNPSDEPGRRLRKVYCMKHSKKGVSAFLKDRKSPFEYEPAPIQSSKERYAPENMIPLDLNEVYWIATREYMSQGYDGYTALKVDKKDTLIDDEQGVIISTLFRRFFLGLKYVNALQDSLTESHNRNERVKELVMTTALKWRQKASSGTKGGDAVVPNGGTGHQKAHHHCSTAAIRKALSGSVQGHPSCIGSESDEEEEEQTVKPQDESHWVQRWASIAPSIDGRIIEVDY